MYLPFRTKLILAAIVLVGICIVFAVPCDAAIEEKIPCMAKKRGKYRPSSDGKQCVQMSAKVYKNYLKDRANAKSLQRQVDLQGATEALHREKVLSLQKETDLLRKLNKSHKKTQDVLARDRDHWKKLSVDLSKPRPVPIEKNPVFWGVIGVTVGAAITTAVILGVQVYQQSTASQ